MTKSCGGRSRSPGLTSRMRCVRRPPKPQGGLPPDAQAMLRNLLRDRFGLVLHPETREQSIYALVRAKQDALGPKLVPSKGTCLGPYTLRQPNEAKPPCPFAANAGLLMMGASSIDDLATMLAFFPVIERPVHDHTGSPVASTWRSSSRPRSSTTPTEPSSPIPRPTAGPRCFPRCRNSSGSDWKGDVGPSRCS